MGLTPAPAGCANKHGRGHGLPRPATAVYPRRSRPSRGSLPTRALTTPCASSLSPLGVNWAALPPDGLSDRFM